jgi:hypothetical protein
MTDTLNQVLGYGGIWHAMALRVRDGLRNLVFESGVRDKDPVICIALQRFLALFSLPHDECA